MGIKDRSSALLPAHLRNKQCFVIDPDIALELEDRARAADMPWNEWLEQFVNESIRANLFG